MAGIFKAFQKILMGQPVFEDESTKLKEPATDQASISAPIQNFEVPFVKIERIEYQELVPNDMTLNVHIKNYSNQNVVLQKIEMLGNNKGLGYTLRPGENKEIVEVYRGKKMPNTNTRHFDLDYKGSDGRFYRTVHTAQYKQEADGTYGVIAARQEGPVQKI